MEAKNVFPELATVPDNRIEFYVTATMSGAKARVRVSPSAWAAATARLLRGEVIDVEVDGESEAPPQYLDVPHMTEKARSAPCSRSHSRESSPAPSNTSDSNGGWWNKHFGS